MRLVLSDIDAGFAEWLPGGLDEVRRRFGAYCAAGKLGLVKKEGLEPRLVGDSSTSHANQLCRNQEKVELPSLHDVAVSLFPGTRTLAGPLSLWTCLKCISALRSTQPKEGSLFLLRWTSVAASIGLCTAQRIWGILGWILVGQGSWRFRALCSCSHPWKPLSGHVR